MRSYNFLFIFGNSPWAEVAYADLVGRSDCVCLFSPRPAGFCASWLYRIHNNPRLNRWCHLPAKQYWFPHLFRVSFAEQRPLCVVIDSRCLQYEQYQLYVPLFRQRYPGCKVLAYYFDVVPTYLPLAQPNLLSALCDGLLSYDPQEAECYGMYYHPTSFSAYAPAPSPSLPPTDVFFVGVAKNRLPRIVQYYRQLTEAGLVCDFYIAQAKKEDRVEAPGLHYVQQMPYREALQRLQHSRMVLEIQQEGAKGPTLRVWESIAYGKGLLTDNVALAHSPWYRSDYVSLLRQGQVDVAFLKAFVPHKNPLAEALQPAHLLDFLNTLCHHL